MFYNTKSESMELWLNKKVGKYFFNCTVYWVHDLILFSYI